MKTSHLIALLAASILWVPGAGAFSDSAASPHETAIETLYEAGVIEGYPDGTYRPDSSINRAEFVKVLIEAKDPGSATGSSCFLDVNEEWFAPYVCSAKTAGVVQGYADGNFRPAAPINLAEALKVVLETYEIETDDDGSMLWYEAYYEKAEDLDLLDGVSRDVAHELSRGEMAQLIYNLVFRNEDLACEAPLFGFWGLNGVFEGDIVGNLNAIAETTGMNAFVTATSASYAAHTQLPAVDEANLVAALRLSGGNVDLIDAEGDFSVDHWKNLVNEWADPDLESALDPYWAKEVKWHMMLDDIDTFDDAFGGHNPTAAELAIMAEYSKTLFPTLKTFLRHDADDMPSGDYPFLDATLNQYSARKGSIASYVASNLAAAESLGVDTIWGLNIVDGGDGSSGHPGTSTSKFVMSPEEIQTYGEVLINTPGSLGLLMWEYDAYQTLADGVTSAERFGTAEYEEVFKELASLGSCQ